MYNEDMKKCPKCGLVKKKSEYYPYVDKRSGCKLLHYRCKKCTRKDNAEYKRKRRKVADNYDWAYPRLQRYRLRSEKHGQKSDFDCDFIIKIFNSPCSYCGLKSNPSIDRIDNSIGYIKSNCVPACLACNKIRSDIFTPEEMKIIGNFIKKKRLAGRIF